MAAVVIVLDTNVTLFWQLKEPRLSTGLLERLNHESSILYCSVTLWEIGLKMKQGKLHLPWSIREIQHKLALIRNLEEVAVTSELWLSSLEIEWNHRDPADRLIVALAKRFDCDLATTDTTIHEFYKKCVC